MKKAFTIIELIIFMGIFSILIYILSDIFIISLKTKTEGEVTSVLNQDARLILFKLSSDINNANAILSPDLGASSSTLRLILYGEEETIKLDTTNHNIEIVDSSGTNILNNINTKITNLAFTRLGNPDGKNTIRIILEIGSKNNRSSEVINLDTAIGLR